MTVIVDGFVYHLSNDYATDTGQSWSWDGVTPTCPDCGDRLVLSTPFKSADVVTDIPGSTELECECGWKAILHG